MLGVDPRAFRIIWTIFLFALLLGTVYAIRNTLLLFAVSIFFAYMLAPLVDLVEHITQKHRGTALAIVYVVLVAALVALSITLGSRIVDQASSLFSKLPDLVEHDRLQSIPLPSWSGGRRDPAPARHGRLERAGAAAAANRHRPANRGGNSAAKYCSAASAVRRTYFVWHQRHCSHRPGAGI